MATQEQQTVAFVLYPGLTLLDLVGPLQVFASLRQFNDQYRPVVVAERLEPMATDGPLTVTADHTFGDVPDPAVVLVPGGDAPTIKAMGNPAVREYLRHAADTVPVVGSVCTGALILAAAGLLEGRTATTHWAYHRLLERLGAAYLPKRWVEDGKFINLGRGVGWHRHGLGAGRPADRRADRPDGAAGDRVRPAPTVRGHRLGPGGPGHLRADAGSHGATAAGRPARAVGEAERLSRQLASGMGAGGGASHVRLVVSWRVCRRWR
jgi:putative intracellular protease/amidase